MRRSHAEAALPWVVALALALLWEGLVRGFAVPEFLLPAPSAIGASMAKWWWPLLDSSARTLLNTALGFALAVAFGLALGVAIGASPLLYRALYPLLIGFNSVPKVAVVPVLVIWFGSGIAPAVITAFLISFFPIVVNVATGIATVEPVHFSTDADTIGKYWKVRKGTFPSVGAVRKTGTTVIIEDVAFPVQSLAAATLDLQALMREHG